MLKTKAIFERKTNDFQLRDCVIEKIIELNSREYDAFSKNMLADYDFIKDNIDLMYVDQEGIYHCLLVVGEEQVRRHSHRIGRKQLRPLRRFPA